MDGNSGEISWRSSLGSSGGGRLRNDLWLEIEIKNKEKH